MKLPLGFVVLISWANIIFIALAYRVKVRHHTPQLGTGVLNESPSDPTPLQIFRQYGSLHTMDSLSFWANKEDELYITLVKKRQQIQQEISLITGFVTDFENSSGNAFASAKKPMETTRDWGRLIGSSPVLANLMTERYTNTLGCLRKLLNSKEYQNTEQEYLNVLDTEDESVRKNGFNIWPSLIDFYVSSAAILRMHNSYSKFKPKDISKGQTIDTRFGGKLRTSDCVLLAAVALFHGQYALSLEWVEFALVTSSAAEEYEDVDGSANFDDRNGEELIKHFITVVIQTHNRQLFYEGHKGNVKLVDLFIEPVIPSWRMEIPRLHARDLITKQLGEVYGNHSHPYYNMISICNGKELQPISIKSRLYCYLDKSSHPYFILNALKTEQLSKYPLILQFYEVLGNETLEGILARRGKLKLEPVSEVESDELSNILIRRSFAANVPTDKLLQNKIKEKTELVTGLIVESEEEDNNNKYSRRIVEYTYGRHFSVHRDLFYERDNPTNSQALEGEPCATLLFNLKVPANGGASTFCSVGISSYPVQGSAVYWTNMFRNGTIRNDVYHAGCPVTHGNKMILTQWIPYHANFRDFMCTLSELE